jgi:hypothetical protein
MGAQLMVSAETVGIIAHQTTNPHKALPRIYGRYPMALRQLYDLVEVGKRERAENDRLDMMLLEGRKSLLEIAVAAAFDNVKPQPQRSRGRPHRICLLFVCDVIRCPGKKSDRARLRNHFVQEIEPLAGQIQAAHSSEICARPVEARYKAVGCRIAAVKKDDRDGRGGGFGSKNRTVRRQRF